MSDRLLQSVVSIRLFFISPVQLANLASLQPLQPLPAVFAVSMLHLLSLSASLQAF